MNKEDMDEMYQQANNTHCFECGSELNEDNTSMWGTFRQLENTDIKTTVNQCVVCAEVNSRMLGGAKIAGKKIIPIRKKEDVLRELLNEFSVEDLKNREIQTINSLENVKIKDHLRLMK